MITGSAEETRRERLLTADREHLSAGRTVRRAVGRLGPDRLEVVPVPPSAVPFTTSGRVRRHEARKLLDNRGPLESRVPTSAGKDTRS